MTFNELATLWIADKKQYVKKSTYATYTILLQSHLQPAFGQRTDITEELVQQYVLAKLQEGLSRKTIKDMLVILKMILKFGSKWHMKESRSIEIKFPTDRENTPLEVLSISSQRKIMQHIKDNFSFQNLGIYICLLSGIRIGEICALKWEDIDTSNGIIKINKTLQRIYTRGTPAHTELIMDTPKSKNSIREIPMTKELLSIIKPLKRVVNNEYYVLTNNPHPTEPRTYRNHYYRLMKHLELPALKFHGLRHSFATRCIESRCDYKTVSVLLGHSNISTTLNLYVHPNMEQKKRCIEQMLKALK